MIYTRSFTSVFTAEPYFIVFSFTAIALRILDDQSQAEEVMDRQAGMHAAIARHFKGPVGQ